jgi:hypothetical protein
MSLLLLRSVKHFERFDIARMRLMPANPVTLVAMSHHVDHDQTEKKRDSSNANDCASGFASDDSRIAS